MTNLKNLGLEFVRCANRDIAPLNVVQIHYGD